MWSLTINVPVGQNATSHVLLYEHEARAREDTAALKAAIAAMDDPDGPAGVTVFLRDDFGTEIDLPASVLDDAVIVFQDVRRGLEGGVKRALIQNEAQNKANQAAARHAALAQPIITPNGRLPLA